MFFLFRSQLVPFFNSYFILFYLFYFSFGVEGMGCGFVGNNSSTQQQTELKFWPQVVFIVQIPFKGFWKAQTFAEKF